MVFTHDVSEPKLPGRGLNGVCVCVCLVVVGSTRSTISNTRKSAHPVNA